MPANSNNQSVFFYLYFLFNMIATGINFIRTIKVDKFMRGKKTLAII